MSSSVVAILGVAVLISLGLALSLHAARLTNFEVLPGYCRRRLRWWQANAMHVQIACAIAAVVATSVQISSIVG